MKRKIAIIVLIFLPLILYVQGGHVNFESVSFNQRDLVNGRYGISLLISQS